MNVVVRFPLDVLHGAVRATIARRLFAELEIRPHATLPTPCWCWTRSSRGRGYGAIKIGGKVYDAHRVAFELVRGDIASGQLVMHGCDVRACVNPEHLELGTHKDNYDDMIRKGRGVDPESVRARNIARGIRPPAHGRFNAGDVARMRARAADGFTHAAIAEEFGVTGPTITRILNGRLYGHFAGAAA